ncbi:LOW QUALITY PROTEIN: hypothetical protein CVT26_011194 [Gymnopilus dilepis]|uniref:Uncharacterized protein n=1 Tax=Gymnopilus dilepis TaxID=231916 RepID=A0A409VJW6_9AGAR|nr:LOW QUALITY PROTEIN: hypothetical protein CVT26_011194 [Gymnopilus dilepis]
MPETAAVEHAQACYITFWPDMTMASNQSTPPPSTHTKPLLEDPPAPSPLSTSSSDTENFESDSESKGSSTASKTYYKTNLSKKQRRLLKHPYERHKTQEHRYKTRTLLSHKYEHKIFTEAERTSMNKAKRRVIYVYSLEKYVDDLYVQLERNKKWTYPRREVDTYKGVHSSTIRRLCIHDLHNPISDETKAMMASLEGDCIIRRTKIAQIKNAIQQQIADLKDILHTPTPD